MNSIVSRGGKLVRPLVVVCALSACGVEERAALQAELAAARTEGARASTEAARLGEEAAKNRRLLLEYRREKDASADRAQAATRQAAAKVEASSKEAAAKIDAAAKAAAESSMAAAEAERSRAELHAWFTKNPDQKRAELERAVAHRDELKEWVEKELLPIAEERDKRLVNLRETAQEMAAEVERIRGLKFKRPFMRRLVSREQTGEWMRREARKEMPPEKAKKAVAVQAVFGLCRPDTDYPNLIGQLAEAGVAAFYNPETGTFYHVSGNDGRGARPVAFHELVHALDDQYFDLTALDDAAKGDSDRGIALKGLVEGSAAYHEGIYEKEHPDDFKAMMQSQDTPEARAKQMKMANEVPPALVAVMALYPYNNAKAWVASMHPDAAAMERLFKDPPVSTEQVLHPSKFPPDGPRDYPHKIETPDVAAVLGAAFENVDDDDVGELVIGVLLTQLQNGGRYLPTLIGMIDMKTQGLGIKGAAKTASEGWDGDRYTAWSEKASGKVVVVWTSVWDSEKDAQEFGATYGDLLGKRVQGKDWKSRPTPIRYVDADGRVSGLDIQGNRVVAVLDAPADKADALFAAGAAAKVTADPRDPNDK